MRRCAWESIHIPAGKTHGCKENGRNSNGQEGSEHAALSTVKRVHADYAEDFVRDYRNRLEYTTDQGRGWMIDKGTYGQPATA